MVTKYIIKKRNKAYSRTKVEKIDAPNVCFDLEPSSSESIFLCGRSYIYRYNSNLGCVKIMGFFLQHARKN